MELSEWSDRIERVSAGYGEYFGVERTLDWTLLKLTEEVGELTQAHLALTGQGRNRGKTVEEMRNDLEGEVADVLAMVLVFAHRAGVDVEEALTSKWLPWEEFHERRRAGEVVEPLAHRWGTDRPSEPSGALASDPASPGGGAAPPGMPPGGATNLGGAS